MSIDATIDHRDPIFSVEKNEDLEAGALLAFYSNLSRAANGDGEGGGEEGAIDFNNPIIGPLSLFTSEQAGNSSPHSFGHGRYGFGPYGSGEPGSLDVQLPYALRNGVYRIAVRIRDALGNERTDNAADFTFEVAALPRPASNAFLDSYDETGGTILIKWHHSREYE